MLFPFATRKLKRKIKLYRDLGILPLLYPLKQSRLEVDGDARLNGRLHLVGANTGVWLGETDAYKRVSLRTFEKAVSIEIPGNSSALVIKNDYSDSENKRNHGFVGIGRRDPTVNLDVNGNARVRGSLYVDGLIAFYMAWSEAKSGAHWYGINASGGYQVNWNEKEPAAPSDLRLKREMEPLSSPLDKICKLRGVTYRWNDTALRYFTRNIESTVSAGPNATEAENQKAWQTEREQEYKRLDRTQVGVVAQEVESILPEAVATGADGYRSVNYQFLIPLLIEALKKQEKTV